MFRTASRRALLGAGAAGVAAAVTGAAAPASATNGSGNTATAGDMSLPTSRLAREARQLVTAIEEPYLRNHSLRSFLFGRAAAGRAGQVPDVDYDVELMFLICVLHDVGLTDHANTNQRFEVDSADFAALFLEERGVTDHRVDTIWDAIATHTTGTFRTSPVFQRRRPPEIGIAQIGIGIDLLGGPDGLPPGYADRVHAVYPRLGGARAITGAVTAQALANPLKAPPMTFPGEVLHQRHPELPYTTWEMFLDAGGWGD